MKWIRPLRLGVWCALGVLGWGSGLRMSAQNSSGALPIPDDAMIERAQGLDIEQRRYLVYLYARLNKPKVARAIGLQVLAGNPSDRQTLLVLASMAAEQKDGEETVHLAEDFLTYYPGDHQGRYFLGAGYYLQRRFAEAERVLGELKREQFNGKRYPYETDLAASAAGAGQWYRAMLSYQELLRNHALSDELRSEVREAIDRIYREHGPRIDARYEGIDLSNGAADRGIASHAMHLRDRQWWEVEIRQDRVTIEPAPGLLRRVTQRAEADTNVRTTWNRRWTTRVGIGGGEAGMKAEMRARYTFAPSRTAEGTVQFNQRANDSLLLESLDGRQHRAELAIAWLAEADLSVNVRAFARELALDGERLGRGVGAEMAVDHTLWRGEPQWVVGYRGAWSTFSREADADPRLVGPVVDPALPLPVRRDILRNLIASRINRHGFGLFFTDNLADAWTYRFALGGDYDFVLDSFGYNVSFGAIFRPRKSVELGAEAGYNSSANASNAGSDAVLLNLSLRFYY